MRTKIFLTTCLVLALSVNAFSQNMLPSPPAGLEGNRTQLTQKLLDSKDENLFIQVLQLDGDTEDYRYLKMLAAKRLSVYGTEKAIPALIQMLSHPQMGYYTRYALEPMPFKGVDEALREETKKQKGMALVGVLTTIGVRRDAGVVPFLEPLLANEDPDVVRATYSAYGYIGNEECAEILKKAVDAFKPEYEKAVFDAALNCAELLVKDGKLDLGLSVYDAVLNSKSRAFLKEGAIFGRILARKAAGTDDLVRYLHSDDVGIFEAALQTVRLLPGGGQDSGTASVCKVLVAELDKFPPRRKGLILEALAGRKDDESRKAALDIATSVKEPEVVRVSAMNALGALDIPEAVPTLLAGAADNGGKGAVADAAFRSLVFMKNKDADAAIAKAMTDAGNKIDSAMIRIARERRTAAATPQLWTIVKAANSPLRGDAIDALGETATLKDLPEIAKLIASPKNDAEKTKIAVALSSLCARMPQQESFNDIVSIFEKSNSRPVKEAMIDLLKTIGGKAAVDEVTKIALSNTPLADKATQVLGTWDSPDTMAEIADSLLKVAKESRFQTRGVRGYIRLARQFSYPEDQRIKMIRTAFDTATRKEDKELIFDIFARYPSLKMAEAAFSYASEEGFQENACAAAVATATKLQGRVPPAAELMKKVIAMTKNADTKSKAESVRDKLAGVDEGVEIVRATYGAGDKQADVTAKVRSLSGGSTVLEIGSYNGAFGDPANNVVKTLKITYKIKGGPEKTAEFNENAPVVLPK